MAIGLSVEYETWPLIGRQHAFVIGWFECRLGLPSKPLYYGLTWPVWIPTVFQTPVTVLLHSPNSRQCLLLGLCKGTVKQSSCQLSPSDVWVRDFMLSCILFKPWDLNKMANILQITFSNAFHWMEVWYFDSNFNENCCQQSNWQFVSICSWPESRVT